jgi:hypothetical protein
MGALVTDCPSPSSSAININAQPETATITTQPSLATQNICEVTYQTICRLLLPEPV